MIIENLGIDICIDGNSSQKKMTFLNKLIPVLKD